MSMFPRPHRTFREVGPKLDIELEGGLRHYGPGDVIIGRVVRRAPILTTSATARIALHGRSFVNITERRGKSDSRYTGTVKLVQESSGAQEVLRGPLHVADGGGPQSWPFALAIPTHADPGRVDDFHREHSYVALDAPHPLPGSYSGAQAHFGSHAEAHVEYFLRAALVHVPHGSGTPKTRFATLPVEVRAAPQPADEDGGAAAPRCLAKRGSLVQTYHLLPGAAGARLTVAQRARQLVGSSRVPSLGGVWQLASPAVVRPGAALEVVVRFVPDHSRSSAEVVAAAPPLRLVSLRLVVAANALVQCPSNWLQHPHVNSVGSKREFRVWPPPAPSYGSVEDLFVTYGKDPEDSPPLDVGAAAGFRLPAGVLTPSFTTYNIRLRYNFRFILVFSVAGEDVEVDWTVRDVVILPHLTEQQQQQQEQQEQQPPPSSPPPLALERSESWIHPPDQTQVEPPSFEEAVEQRSK